MKEKDDVTLKPVAIISATGNLT